jgi:tetratricopeptide (TPR) repeat protein
MAELTVIKQNCFKRRSEGSLREAMPMRWTVLFLFLGIITVATQAQVRVREGVLDLPAYEEGVPDPNPPFDQFATGRFNYPYTMRKEITDHRVEHRWRAIYLENEYLKCSVLPDLGGHIYACIDKISGQPMFYANPSIKKARIGYRGAWAAFGVEFNFPVSHNWVSMSPVDFAYAGHEDGSASVIVGNIDRVYGMEWLVELTLRPGSTILEQHVTLSNRSDVRHRFYWWNNAAVQVWDDSQIQYPMRFVAAHGFAEVQRWPVDSQGRDLTVIHNQTDGPVSLFVHGSRENFMGVWHPRTNTGTAHFADYAELPAKKIWSWGVDADGLNWRKALSDNNSAYVELQAGLFRNQETYAFLEPRQSIAFTEYWIPVRGTGGISRANLAGVVHLERKAGMLAASFNANLKLTSATIRILDGSSSLLNEKGDLVPERVWKREIQIPSGSRKYTFELKNSEGALLLRQTEGEYDWVPESEIKVGPQISYKIPDEMHRTEDDWLQQGKTEELNGNLLAALETYQKALMKFPTDFELLKAAGRLDTCLERFEEAVSDLSAAHGRNTSDAEISYYLGIAYEGVERENVAVDAYQEAMRLPSYRAGAALRLAELLARRGALEEAKSFLKKSLESAPDDLRAGEELAAVSRALGRTADGEKIARERLAHFPLSDFLKEELGKPNILHFAADPYRVLNVASEYARLGLYRRAVEVLSREYPSADADQSEPGAVVPQKNPLVAYFRGYCREKLGESGANDYLQASRLSTVNIFPNTIEDQQSLKAAIRTNEKDATAHYLLGTWYFAHEKTEAAISEWQQARKLNPQIPVLEASLGLALLHMKRDFAGALSVFAEGIRSDPSNVVNYSGTVAAMAVLGKPPAERVKALELYPGLDRMPTSLVYELALNRAEEGNYEGATDLFQNRFFGSEEGGTNVRQVWLEVKLQQAYGLARSGHCEEALATAKTLGSPVVGLAFTQDGLEPLLNSARTNYLLGETYSACGQKEEADRNYRLSAQATDSSDVVWAWASAKKLRNYDSARWQERLSSVLSQAESNARTSAYQGWWLYSVGILQMALGRDVEGKASLRESLFLPENRMSYHLSRLAMEGATPR